MVLALSSAEYSELWQHHSEIALIHTPIDEFEVWEEMPTCLGKGHIQSMELVPGVWLDILNFEYQDDLFLKVPVHDHLVQCSLLLNGLIHHEDVYPTIGGTCSYLSGSGISPGYVAQYERSQRLLGVSIHLSPELLEPFLLDGSAHTLALKSLLLRDHEWKTSFFPDVTLPMQRVVQQILKTPLKGVVRRLYLQAKVFELLGLQLDRISVKQPSSLFTGFKSDTIARIHHAKEILTQQLEHPPSLLELAQQVGVSDRTLRRGFQELFGTTVVGYLTQQRMQQAEQLLRAGNCTVAEVANRVGYAHLGHFAAAFKRQFGITPRECLAGQLSVLGS
ncbi:helix-turn-helix transcriptional regulator [Oscillatoria sp. FACHB-1407]|uniref:helix-turn-helix transcriptional regulator n=1 Tax=Oscillatoria sp. FACHB-1407 TaxID=2692847 RepID=UPI00168736C6|nr:AraC family transcriptional regulator [Oscillatoria sp. FACHB-1407]MBD2463179.1 helix-turn-helix transcriptional regulator [Oscillatoria sp. FACHB-1407]